MHTYTFVCFIFVYHTPPPKVPHKNMENPSVLIKTDGFSIFLCGTFGGGVW